tara:strand:+ start:767 stop:928 length:162 start_codon:yes stop_codon:yes gene_type:complete
MIKHIINIIKGWFSSKEEMDPHAEFYLKEEESDVPVYNRKLEKINRKHKKGAE